MWDSLWPKREADVGSAVQELGTQDGYTDLSQTGSETETSEQHTIYHPASAAH